MTEINADANLRVVSFRPEYAADFERLNREWIERYFAVEENDTAVFDDPHGAIIETGGAVFFLVGGSGEVLGTCAVIRLDDEVYELAKMAVSPSAQGRGYGELLMRAAIEFARDRGARTLMLQTNSRLAPAIRLYSKYGFRRVPLEAHGYSRANVQMELDL